MQLFVRLLQSETAVVSLERDDSLRAFKSRLQERCGVPEELQRLRYGLRDLREDADVRELRHGATISLLLRLPGGKGGFGSLLRVQGRDTKATTNFEACRDLTGRRMRHVNAVKKMQEWHKNAKERELEDIAVKHIVERARETKRIKRAPIDRGVVHEMQKKTVDDVKDAVRVALDRKSVVEDERAKRRFLVDSDSESESSASESSVSDSVEGEADGKLIGKRKRT